MANTERKGFCQEAGWEFWVFGYQKKKKKNKDAWELKTTDRAESSSRLSTVIVKKKIH